MSTYTSTRNGQTFAREHLLGGAVRLSLTGRFATCQVSGSESTTVAEYASEMQSAEMWIDANGAAHPAVNNREIWSEDV